MNTANMGHSFRCESRLLETDINKVMFALSKCNYNGRFVGPWISTEFTSLFNQRTNEHTARMGNK